MIKTKHRLKNLAVLLTACLIGLAVLELLLRLYNPLEIRFKPDRIVLPVNKRYVLNHAGTFTKLPPVTVHTKNSLGFRGEAPPRNFRDYLTIVTIGGSTTECFFLSDGKTWPDILGQKLSEDFHRVWINNAGLDGATTHRHLILMEDYVIRLQPKVVLFLIGINDVGAGDIGAAEKHKKDHLKKAWRAVLYRSEAYALGQNLYRYLVAKRRGLPHTEIDLESVPLLERLPAADQMLRDHRMNSLPFFTARVERLIAVCRDHGIEPVLVTQPTLYGPGLDADTGVNLEKINVGNNLNGRLKFDIVDLYNQATRNMAREKQVLLIDLAGEMPRNSAYYYDYLHYTEAGAAVVAHLIARQLEPFLAQQYPSFKKSSPPRD